MCWQLSQGLRRYAADQIGDSGDEIVHASVQSGIFGSHFLAGIPSLSY
jgi:hypothetical protein